MQFGIQVEPQFGHAYSEVLEIARDAERAGLALWVSDHLFLNELSADTNCLEAWTLLAALAQGTTTLRLGTLVTCQSYRNPALLAKIAAGVDHISNGRLEFGVGAGWKQIEYRAYGFSFPPARVRLEELIDTLEIVRRMWSEERATYRGKHYRVESAPCAPKPVQKPRPRIWVGGGKRGILRATARYADAINYMPGGGFPTAEAYRGGMATLDAECRRIGREPSEVLRSAFIPIILGGSSGEVDRTLDELAAKAKQTRDEFRRARPAHLIGTPDQVAGGLRRLAEAGVGYAIVLFPYGRERAMLPLLARGVAAALA